MKAVNLRLVTPNKDDEKSDGLLSIVDREPERSRFLAKVGLVGTTGITVWAFAGPLVLSVWIVLPVAIALFGAFGLTLTIMTARLVRAADHWQVESALHARRLLSTTGKHVETQEQAPPPFHLWFFRLRLEEEIRRHRRQGDAMSVVVLKVSPPGSDTSHAVIEQVEFEMARIASHHIAEMLHTTQIDTLEYSFCLAETDGRGAKTMVARLLSALGDYWCLYGIAVYPENGTKADALLDYARDQCEGSIEQRAA